MIEWIKRIWKKPELKDFEEVMSRERLIASSRVLFIDDEEQPLLLEELKSALFAVDHDKTGNDTRNIDSQLYDVIILDYHGVGARLGTGQGLSLLKHIRRVSPRSRVIAYTSRSLSATESEFFRSSHAVLPKDLGLADSLAIVEAELRKAHSKHHLFEALIEKLNISDPLIREKAYEALVGSLKARNSGGFKSFISGLAGKGAEKAVEIIMAKLFPTP